MFVAPLQAEPVVSQRDLRHSVCLSLVRETWEPLAVRSLKIEMTTGETDEMECSPIGLAA